MSALLELDQIAVKRGNDEQRRVVLDGVSLCVDEGDWIDVTGASGCGKSTLLEAIVRFLALESGSMRLAGADAEDIPPPLWRTRVALVQQKPVALPGTVMENLTAGYSLDVREDRSPPPDDVLLAELYNTGLMNVPLDRPANELSLGQLARIGVLRILLLEPQLLLIDEPSANLDPASAAELTRRLIRYRKEGGTIVRVRHHDPDGLATCMYALHEGRLQEVHTS